MITLDQLAVLEAIERCGTFTAAAKDLGRATSALSYSVRTLETNLDLVLFDRSQHRARLTDKGTLLVEEAHKVLAQAAEFERTAQRLKGGWEPRLTIVIDGLVPMVPVMRAVRRFTELGAITRLEVLVESYRSARRRFLELDADLMLTLDSETDANLRAVPLPPMELLLVAVADHPLVLKRQRLVRDDLAEHVQIRLEDSSAPGDLGQSVFSFSDVRAQREAVLSGVGFGWLPRHLVSDDLRSKRVSIVTFEEGFRLRRVPRIVYRRDRTPGLAAAAFVDTLTHEIDKLVSGPKRRA